MSDRTVHTDAVATLGQLIDETQKRDAIHLATEPVVAAEKLFPGQDVGLHEGLGSARAAKMVGIVDPFLKGPVFPGERFWLIVYPRQITSLRHTWEHPDFPELSPEHPTSANVSDPVALAVKRLTEFAEAHDLTYGDLMKAAKDEEGAEDFYVYGENSSGYAYVDDDFWADYSIVMGYTVELTSYGDGCRGC